MKAFILCLILLPCFELCANVKQARFYGNGELSCNMITDINQDKNGFVWVGTINGLNRFDGWKFKRYYHEKENPNSLLSHYIFSLYTDSGGKLWVGTNKGLQYYSAYEDAFHTVAFPDSLEPPIEKIVELENGELWVLASYSHGVFRVDKERMIAESIEEINLVWDTRSLSVIYKDRSHNLWIPIASGKLLHVIMGEQISFEIIESLKGYVHSFAEDGNNRLYVSTYNEVSYWDPLEKKFIPVENQGSPFYGPKLLASRNGGIYMATTGQGFKYIDVHAMKVRDFYAFESREVNLDKINVQSWMEDRDGNLWVGCFRYGLLMIPDESSFFDFIDCNPRGVDIPDIISAIHKGREGSLWVGTENGKVLHIQHNGMSEERFGFSNDVVSLYEDSENTFWIGVRYRGVYQVEKGTVRKRDIPIRGGEYPKHIIEDKHKRLYFSFFGDGLGIYHLETGEWRLISKDTYPDDHRLKDNGINTILCDSRGKIWLGHYKGINCYDPDADRMLPLPCNSVLNATICYSLLEDRNGQIWVGTNNGLYSYHPDSEKLAHYSMKEGLSDNVICGLAEDRAGNIWCSTFRGLCRINEERQEITGFLSGNGLYDKEYSRGVYFQNKGEEVYFGGFYGITHFYPDSITGGQLVKEPCLTGLFLNNQSVSGGTSSGNAFLSREALINTNALCLSYKDNTFTTEFSMMDFHDPENIFYEYRLYNINREWSQTSPGSNRITYNRLPPGKYTLDVRACENGAYSQVKKLQIEITPPWYFSVTSKIIYAFIIFSMVCACVYYARRYVKKRQLEEIKEEKLRFFINISHEIRSPMTLILSPLSMLMKKEYDIATTKALNSMYQNANRIVALLNQLLDIRRLDKGQMKMTFSQVDIVVFIRELLRGFEYHIEKWNMTLRFECSENALPVWIDQNNFDKVLLNLLDNAFKYTPEGGEIAIEVHKVVHEGGLGSSPGYIEINVLDSGMGIKEKELNKIFERFYQASSNSLMGAGIGLHICKTLVELHHGTVNAFNRKDGSGSCFAVRIPLGCEHLSEEEMTDSAHVTRFALEQRVPYEGKIKPQNRFPSPDNTRHKVLVIDDSEEIRNYLFEELSPLYQVMVYSNAIEGYKAALIVSPELIISDVVMPEMDGFALLKKLKTNSNTNHIPVILLTSRIEYDNRIKGWDKGADAILTKPFNMEELVLLSTNLIDGRVRLKGKFSGIQDQKDNIKPVELKSNDALLMERLIFIINSDIDNPKLNVELLAEKAGIHRVHLHRRLKDMAGITPVEFIRNIRLKQAAELLKGEKRTIAQVAYAVGYANPALFSTAFKTHFGITPKEFQETSQ